MHVIPTSFKGTSLIQFDLLVKTVTIQLARQKGPDNEALMKAGMQSINQAHILARGPIIIND